MTLAELRKWAADDFLAATHQSMGQYRTALLKVIDEVAASAQQDEREAVTAIEWEPLPEDAYERASFDRNLDLYKGDPRLAVAGTLGLWGRTMDRGSFGRVCCVLANEVAKMHLLPMPAQQVQADAGDSGELARLNAIAAEYDACIRHMDAGGDFYAFQARAAMSREQPQGGE